MVKGPALFIVFFVLFTLNIVAQPGVRGGRSDTTIIAFEHKQSALYHLYTKDVIDSLVYLMVKNDSVTLTIDGYAHVDEGIDTIAYYLSLNRAKFVKEYVIGRGVDSTRIVSLKGWGKYRKYYKGLGNQVLGNSRAEMILNWPPPKFVPGDRDEDGLNDEADMCPDAWGRIEEKGCPDSQAVVVPFENGQSSLHALSYHVLDSLIVMMKRDPFLTLTITGHAHKGEGSRQLCDRLGQERSDLVKTYFLSRYINPARITAVASLGCSRPINAGRNPGEVNRNARVEIKMSSPVDSAATN